MRFDIAKEIFDLAPDFTVGVVVARGIDQDRGKAAAARELAAAIARAVPTLTGKAKEDPRILPYREAFRKFGINPNLYQCSIEALATRIAKTGSLPSINAIVDAGNAVSLRAFIPAGAHDLAMAGDSISIRPSRAGDSFTPFGATVAESPEPGEIVYASGPLVRTRRWMWRQSELGKITPETRDVFFPLDGFAGTNLEALLDARDSLARMLEAEFGATVTVGLVDAAHPEFKEA